MSLLRCLAALALATLLVGQLYADQVYAGQRHDDVKLSLSVQRCHPAVCGR